MSKTSNKKNETNENKPPGFSRQTVEELLTTVRTGTKQQIERLAMEVIELKEVFEGAEVAYKNAKRNFRTAERHLRDQRVKFMLFNMLPDEFNRLEGNPPRSPSKL